MINFNDIGRNVTIALATFIFSATSVAAAIGPGTVAGHAAGQDVQVAFAETARSVG
jgi:hypothetical protein